MEQYERAVFFMLILLGPSASGKTESAKVMLNRYPISRVVTCTTRPKRASEIDGFDYQFVTSEQFDKMASEKYFAETATYNGHSYGTPLNQLRDDKLIILEPRGLASFLNLHVCTLVAIFLQTSESVRYERMRYRGDTREQAESRILSDRERFDLAKISGLDMVIDTTNMSVSDIADMIYGNYKFLLAKKQNPFEQMQLFPEEEGL
jgi:guanylate kinase